MYIFVLGISHESIFRLILKLGNLSKPYVIAGFFDKFLS